MALGALLVGLSTIPAVEPVIGWVLSGFMLLLLAAWLVLRVAEWLIVDREQESDYTPDSGISWV